MQTALIQSQIDINENPKKSPRLPQMSDNKENNGYIKTWKKYNKDLLFIMSIVVQGPCYHGSTVLCQTAVARSYVKQCPAGTRTRPDTRYFICYPTRPDSVLKIIGQRVTRVPEPDPIPDISTRTRPDTRYFICYPTRPDSVLKIIGQRVTRNIGYYPKFRVNPEYRVLPDISGKPEVSGITQHFGYPQI